MFTNELAGRSPFSVCRWQIRLLIASILLAIGMPCAMAADVLKGSTLLTGGVLKVGEVLISPSREFFLATQSDGNLCVYHESNGKNVWCSRSSSAGEGNYVTGMQSDGNLCTSRSDGYVAWCLTDRPRYDGPFFLALQDDANVCVYRGAPGAIVGTVWCTMALATPLPHGPPIRYGQSYQLQNDYRNLSGGFLDTRAACPPNALCVSTATVPNRDTGSGTWWVASAEGKANGEPVMSGDKVYFKNRYPLGADNTPPFGLFGGYLDTRGAGCEGNVLCVTTSLTPNTNINTSVWKIVADRHSLYLGQPMRLQNQYANPGGLTYLDTRGDGCAGNLLCVSASLSPNRDQGSGTWRLLNESPAVAANTIGNWVNPSIKFLEFTTSGRWPNFYQQCYGYEVYHPQHVVRLPNDVAGNAYFMVSQSREHNGYITMLKVDAAKVDRINDSISVSGGSVVGEAVWQEVYTGPKNGHINPVGNWNHPGKMSYRDGILAVSAQNWKISDWLGGLCFYNYSALGVSEDKVLFYDVRNPTAPRYLSALTAGELGVPNRELATVELAYDAPAKKYLLNVGGGGAYPVFASDQLSRSKSGWTAVPGAAVFSGQHGLAFDVEENGNKKLVYFDASRSNGGGGTFSFTRYAYSAAPPYLAASGSPQSFGVNLPGANRDWDTSSVYISPITRKPIIYTVKSVDGTPNYQLYEVMPAN
jgi:hypothetical protein